MTYNQIIGTLCRIAAELNEMEDNKHFNQLNKCIFALDDLRDKIQCEISKIENVLTGEDHDEN